MWTRVMQDPIIQILFHNVNSPRTIIWICTIIIISLCVLGIAFVYLISNYEKNIQIFNKLLLI